MSDKKIIILGKEIDYGEMNDERLLKLYNQLIERQETLAEKSEKYIENKQLSDIDINNVNV